MDGHCGGRRELRGEGSGRCCHGLGHGLKGLGRAWCCVRALREGLMGNWGSEEESEVFVGGWGTGAAKEGECVYECLHTSVAGVCAGLRDCRAPSF